MLEAWANGVVDVGYKKAFAGERKLADVGDGFGGPERVPCVCSPFLV